ncbi:MAG: hypothetical protein EPO07_06400 [Verrucomicrobia bacterium]|nr:MAG: hypothetical protein EPO07_06400 [Verrucomicrobiota bacterium]
MPKDETSIPPNAAAPAVQMTLPGLILFSVSLIVATGLLTWFLAGRGRAPESDARSSGVASAGADVERRKSSAPMPPWGELVQYNIMLERPEEYAAFEFQNSSNRTWTFGGMTAGQARAAMLACGVASNLVEHALAPSLAQASAGRVVIQPDPELITALPPEAREKLYGVLARTPENYYMHSPFSFPNESFEDAFDGSQMADATKALITRLSYRRGGRTFFSDLGYVLDHSSGDDERMKVVKALSRLSAVMVRLRITPTTDVDKVVNYWAAPGVRIKDVRPLLESVKRMDDGGTVSLVYLLPPFARERLFTFPLSAKYGEAEVDCHWSTMNFFSEEPDQRFADLNYTSAFISTNYYSIAKPSAYGDLIFVLDERGGAIHSAVYIADDIVFTKNGRSYGQPWLLMHLKDMATAYSTAKEPRLVFYRNKAS